ncbi:26S proteasome non-ATPase regulatory subunit 4 homolog isoform X2 [Tanacetum coccineum]
MLARGTRTCEELAQLIIDRKEHKANIETKLMDGVLGFTLFGDIINLHDALTLAKFRCFNLPKKYKNRNLCKRILVFAGGPVDPFLPYSIEVGDMLANAGIALDVVNYGTQRGGKTKLLNHLVSNANVDIRCRILNLQEYRLYKSDILPLVGEDANFDPKTRRDDNDDMHGDSRKRAR